MTVTVTVHPDAPAAKSDDRCQELARALRSLANQLDALDAPAMFGLSPFRLRDRAGNRLGSATITR